MEAVEAAAEYIQVLNYHLEPCGGTKKQWPVTREAFDVCGIKCISHPDSYDLETEDGEVEV